MEIKMYDKKNFKEILQYQKELYGLNFREMDYGDHFYLMIKHWYDKVGEEYYAHVLLNKEKVNGFYLYQTFEQTAYLMQMFVHKDYRKNKFGLELMNHFEIESKQKKCESLLLHVSSINPHAVDFYSKFGFFIIDIEQDKKGDLRYLMRKII